MMQTALSSMDAPEGSDPIRHVDPGPSPVSDKLKLMTESHDFEL